MCTRSADCFPVRYISPLLLDFGNFTENQQRSFRQAIILLAQNVDI